MIIIIRLIRGKSRGYDLTSSYFLLKMDISHSIVMACISTVGIVINCIMLTYGYMLPKLPCLNF